MENLTSYAPMLLFIAQGALVTLKYSIISVFLGLIIGTLLALSKTSKKKYLAIFADVYTSIFRGTPLIIQLSIMYFAMPSITGIKLSVFAAGVIAFSLNSGAYVSEVIRTGINSVDKGQREAAKALGIPERLIMRDIILPQAIRNILPALINEIINMLKESSIISILGEMDLMRRAQVISAETFTYFAPMLTAALAYYIMVLFFTSLAKYFEKRLAL